MLQVTPEEHPIAAPSTIVSRDRDTIDLSISWQNRKAHVRMSGRPSLVCNHGEHSRDDEGICSQGEHANGKQNDTRVHTYERLLPCSG